METVDGYDTPLTVEVAPDSVIVYSQLSRYATLSTAWIYLFPFHLVSREGGKTNLMKRRLSSTRSTALGVLTK
jgi:hypothetical protein